MKVKQAINPVTIRPEGLYQKQPAVTLMRIGVNGQYVVAVGLSDEANEQPLIATTLTEPQLLAALGHLFPRGELAHVHLDPAETPDTQLMALTMLEELLALTEDDFRSHHNPEVRASWQKLAADAADLRERLGTEIPQPPTEQLTWLPPTEEVLTTYALVLTDNKGTAIAATQVPEALALDEAKLHSADDYAEYFNQNVHMVTPHPACRTLEDVKAWIRECNGDEDPENGYDGYDEGDEIQGMDAGDKPAAE